jgi:hypothetical protein
VFKRCFFVGGGVTGSLATGIMVVCGKGGGSGRWGVWSPLVRATKERRGAGEAWTGVVVSGKGLLLSLGSESLPMSQPDRDRLAL